MSHPQRLLDTSVRVTASSGPLPSRARVLVVGAGVVGASIAYHLAERGVTDVIVLERATVSAGTSWHAAGLLAQVRGSHALTELAQYGPGLYEQVASETGLPVTVERVGSLTTAHHSERMWENLYSVTMARHHGIESHILTPEDIPGLWPLAVPDGLVGAVYFPGDGHLNPGWATAALVTAAMSRGVAVHEGVTVTGILSHAGRTVGVTTDQGEIEAETVVLACGLWTRDLAATAGISVPLYPAAHVHVQTAAMNAPAVPVLRELDGSFYVRAHQGALVVGAFEADGKPVSPSSLAPDFAFGEFPADWEHFAAVRRSAEQRVPALVTADWSRFLNAPESFTPDAAFLAGESPEMRGLYVAAGFNSQGIIYAPGIGRALAAWIEDGAPSFDASGVDIARVGRAQSNRRYLHARTVEGLGRLYAMHWPHLQPSTARGVRRTPLYDRLAAAGACFGEAVGWERANWFGEPGTSPGYVYSYGRQNWFDRVGEEHRAAREGVALFDLSSFAKIEVCGAGALDLLQRVCTSDLDVPVGKVVYTLMLNERGGIELDGTVTRLGEDRFWVITPTVYQHKTLMWLRRYAEGAGVVDVTGAYATLALMGPRSRELMASLTPDDVSREAMPFGTAHEIEFDTTYAHALRVSFVGELGYELYVPVESAVPTFDAIVAAGADLGLCLAGYHALDSLRQEKGYVHLGHDIGPMETPYHARLGFTVGQGKTGFVGAAALNRAGARTPDRRRVHVAVDESGPPLYHDETLLRDGVIVGQVTSGAYGYTLGRAVGQGYARTQGGPTAEWIEAGSWSVEIAGDRVGATVSLTPFYDPRDERLRG